MRLVAAVLLLAACNEDARRFDVEVISEGEGEPNQQPLFHLHPDVLPGVDMGWVEVDGRPLLRLNDGELTDHTLYAISNSGSVYLAGLEQAPLDTPALWVPPRVRHRAEWYQPELERTVYVERGFAPGEWEFQYAVAGMAPELRTRVETTTPQGFPAAEVPEWSSRPIPWTPLGPVGLQPVTSEGSLFVEGPAGASLHVARWIRLFDELGAAGIGTEYTDVDPTASSFTTPAAPPRWPTADGFVEAVRAGGSPVEPLGAALPLNARSTPPRVWRGSAAEHADVYAVEGGGAIPGSMALMRDAAGILGAVRTSPDLHESRLFRDGVLEVRYYATTPSGRIDRYALTPDGWEHTSYGRIEMDSLTDRLAAVWERVDGSLEGLIGTTGLTENNLPDGTHFRISADDLDDGEPVAVLPGILHTEARVLEWPSDERVLCFDPAMDFEPPPGTAPLPFGDGCQIEFAHRERYDGDHDTLGPFHFEGYASPSATGNDAPVRYRLAPGHDGLTIAIDRSGDGHKMGFVYLDEHLFEVASVPDGDISNCRIAWPDGCWEQSAGAHRWHRMDGRVLSSSQQLGTLYVPVDAPALRQAGPELSEVDLDGEWRVIDWPGGRLRFADARWLCVSDGLFGPMTCHARDGDATVSVPDDLTAVGDLRIGADNVPVDPETLMPLQDADPVLMSLANAWERDGVLYARGSESGEVLRYTDGRNAHALLAAGPTPQAPFAATEHFIYLDGRRTPLDVIAWQPVTP